jgi:hypothetical protein
MAWEFSLPFFIVHCTRGISDLLCENSLITEPSGLPLYAETEPCVESLLEILRASVFKNVGGL